MPTHKARLAAHGKYVRQLFGLGAVLAVSLSACEAPLDLSQVEESENAFVRRTDNFLDAAVVGGRSVLVGHGGLVITFEEGAPTARAELSSETLPTPTLVGVSVCPDGGLVALDAQRAVWSSPGADGPWAPTPIGTFEEVMDIDCGPDGAYWVAATFATILTSKDGGQSWIESSLGDDLAVTEIKALSADEAVAFGEFGAVLVTDDAGESWTQLSPLPGEIYPLASLVESDGAWAVGSLNGLILYSDDSGETWSRQDVETALPIYAFVQTGKGKYAFGDFGVVLKQDESGAWRATDDSRTVRGYLRATALTDDGLLAAGGGGAFLNVRFQN